MSSTDKERKLIPKLDFRKFYSAGKNIHTELHELIQLISAALPITTIKFEQGNSYTYRWACWGVISPCVAVSAMQMSDNPLGIVTYRVESIKDILYVSTTSDVANDREENEHTIVSSVTRIFIPFIPSADEMEQCMQKAQKILDAFVDALNRFLTRVDKELETTGIFDPYLA